MSDKWCPLCGNTGIDIDGNPCTCRFNAASFYDTVSCLSIPEQYRGILFNKFLVPQDLDSSYPEYLQYLYDNITAVKWKYHNLVLCSPISHSKTILAYACIEQLFRKGIETFPVFDVLEIKRIMIDLDMARKPLYDVEQPELILTVPYLFTKIPRVSSWEVYDTISMILDRRTRRGLSTIFLYDGYWEQLVKNDRQNILTGLVGDGTYNTLDKKSWYLQKSEELPEIVLEDKTG